MFGLHRPGAFEDGQEADDVGIDVARGVFEAVAHAGLGPEMDNATGRVIGEQGGHAGTVGEVDRVVNVARLGLQPLQPGVLQGRVVIAVEVVDADHGLAARQQAAGGVKADETGRAGDEDGSLAHPSSLPPETSDRQRRRVPVQRRARPSGTKRMA